MPNRTTREILEEARAYIADPERWCRHTMADQHGRVCALGALRKVGANPFGGRPRRLLGEAAYKFYRYMSPACVNDALGHRAVLEMYDEAITNA